MTKILRAGYVFDGWVMHPGASVSLRDDGRIGALLRQDTPLPEDAEISDLGPGILAPGFVDLQVNGGDGMMIGPETDAQQIARICAAHARLGTAAILPTLISDTADVTRRTIMAGIEAHQRGVTGFAGLHLEGPHLDLARKGAHDARMIRPMTPDDLALLCDAARALPALLLTVAPEAVSAEQIAALHKAGAVVSLGHSGCTAAQAQAAYAAGAQCVTHLYNAMGGLQGRTPGLLGAALTTPVAAGIIADGVHVAPECLQIALRMKQIDHLFLVSDAMAVAGTALTEMSLNGRRILREGGRLTLEDGTLAGADVTLPHSVAHLVALGVDLARALAMASRIPADVIGAQDRGRIAPGARADLALLSPDLKLRSVWISGQAITMAEVG